MFAHFLLFPRCPLLKPYCFSPWSALLSPYSVGLGAQLSLCRTAQTLQQSVHVHTITGSKWWVGVFHILLSWAVFPARWRSSAIRYTSNHVTEPPAPGLRALLQCRCCIWLRRNCSPAHKHQGLACVLLSCSPQLAFDLPTDPDPTERLHRAQINMPFWQFLTLSILF